MTVVVSQAADSRKRMEPWMASGRSKTTKCDSTPGRIHCKKPAVVEFTLLLTGAEMLTFTGRMYGLQRAEIAERSQELLALMELDNEPRKLVVEYSHGMKKKLSLACALIHRPEILFLDEPFEGVDAVGARLMKDILLEQVRHGATIFLTSHVLEVVERLCDRVAIINDGKLVREGSMEELRGGSATLEDAFVRAVGVVTMRDTLDWL